MMAAESATQRLGRLLQLVPWLVNRQGIDIEQAAAEFGVSRAQIESDLALLFMCGTPGHMPDDLIEAEWDQGRVYVRNADTIARPLRLGVDEALALIVGLRTLADVPGLGDRDAIDRALAKLVEATGDASAASANVQVRLMDLPAELLSDLRGAVRDHRRVHLRYLVASRDETTERDVDPMRVLSIDGHWYLDGWCHRAQAQRLFRLDRVEAWQVLDEDGTPPPEAAPRDVASFDAEVFTSGPEDIVVTLSLQPHAAWVADYYPVESVHPMPGGAVRVRLRTADLTWLRQLVWRLSGAAEVIEPEELRQQVATGARDALAAYVT